MITVEFQDPLELPWVLSNIKAIPITRLTVKTTIMDTTLVMENPQELDLTETLLLYRLAPKKI